MERQICYVAGQVLFGCVEKWKKKESSMGEIVSNFTLSCLPFASMLVFLEPDATQHWAVGGGAQRGSVIFVLASHSLLLVMFGNEWYSECVLIFSPPTIVMCKEPVKMNIWLKKPFWFQKEVPWIYDLPFLLKYELETGWGEHFLLLFMGPGGAGRVLALGLLPRPEKHFASAEWLAGLPGCCCFLSWFSFVEGQWVWLLAESSCPLDHWPEFS